MSVNENFANLKFEQRAEIKVLIAEGKLKANIHNHLVNVYQDESPFIARVKRLVAELKRSRISLSDDPRPGRPSTSVTPENIIFICELIDQNYKIKRREICTDWAS